MRERLLECMLRFISRASRRGLGLFGSLREGKFPRVGIDGGLGDRGLLGGLSLRIGGLRWRLRP